ncbi:N-acetylmuramoyl-L-alanine amidase [Planococcus wigleyi]|uniref:N-acetylmuramoyl-L-alanine amidase n=1 Tax=Planococcus wigleyi TaxID=2762216 RepID=A0ABR8WA77_9BACL|nr:N-acetylmuramoyl-L-alanine amidase [Planococcus wigleyi]MBD8013902.1 N-acetylmuramoyl-L-alanine amidase [Planococcus wigleyi]
MAVNKTVFLKAQKVLIAIDWGHGPGTPGKETPYIQSLGRKIQEEEFNIPAAKALAAALQAQGFKTMFTADESYDTPLATRVKRANAAGADIFISIHFNAMGHTFGYSTAKGFSAHIQQGMSKTSSAYKLASLMVQELAAGTPQVNRGVVFQPLYVTRWTNMPAVLVELGFMDDPFEAGLMLQKSFHQEVAMELTKAVNRYTGLPYSGGAVQAAKPVAREYLMLDDQGAGVRAMQDYYKKAGYKITVDSIFGKDTKAVVVAFQTKYGLKPDGVHGTATAAKLAEVIATLGNPKPKPVVTPAKPNPVTKPKEEKPMAKSNEPSKWAKETIDKAKEIGVTDGTNLHGTPTREETIVIAMRAAGLAPRLK